MKTPLPEKDFEALSAYLDGQLGDRERARLEARLQTEEALRAALERLQNTRAVLRGLPPLPVPRSFTLDPETVPARPARDFYPVMRFASALASILLVVVLLGDIAASFALQRGLAPAQELALQAADQEAAEPAPDAAPDSAAAGEGAAEFFATEAGEPADETALAAEAPPEPEEDALEEQGADGAAADDAGSLPTPTLDVCPTQVTETPPAELQDRGGLPATQPGPQLPDPDADESGEAPETQPNFVLRPLTILEILLAFTAVGTGATALLLRRRR